MKFEIHKILLPNIGGPSQLRTSAFGRNVLVCLMLSEDSDIKSNQPQQKPSRQQDHCHEEGSTEDEAADCHASSLAFCWLFVLCVHLAA